MSRRPNRIIQILLIHRPRIVPPKRLIVVTILGIQLLQTIAMFRPLRSIPNHLQDTALRILRIKLNAIMALHEPRVADTIIRGPDSHIAATLLYNDTQDHADIDAGRFGNRLDRRADMRDLGVRVVELHQFRIVLPEIIIACPLSGRWEVRRRTTVVDVFAAALRAALRAGDVIVVVVTVALLGEIDLLTDLEGFRFDSWVSGFEGLDCGSVSLGDFVEGVAGFDGVGCHIR